MKKPPPQEQITINYYISAGNSGDGKSVCLWRQEEEVTTKIARFQSDAAAKLFAEDLGFPLSEALTARLNS
jgi:hypothetical protein